MLCLSCLEVYRCNLFTTSEEPGFWKLSTQIYQRKLFNVVEFLTTDYLTAYLSPVKKDTEDLKESKFSTNTDVSSEVKKAPASPANSKPVNSKPRVEFVDSINQNQVVAVSSSNTKPKTTSTKKGSAPDNVIDAAKPTKKKTTTEKTIRKDPNKAYPKVNQTKTLQFLEPPEKQYSKPTNKATVIDKAAIIEAAIASADKSTVKPTVPQLPPVPVRQRSLTGPFFSHSPIDGKDQFNTIETAVDDQKGDQNAKPMKESSVWETNLRGSQGSIVRPSLLT